MDRHTGPPLRRLDPSRRRWTGCALRPTRGQTGERLTELRPLEPRDRIGLTEDRGVLSPEPVGGLVDHDQRTRFPLYTGPQTTGTPAPWPRAPETLDGDQAMNRPILEQLEELVNENPNAPAQMDPTPPDVRARLLRTPTLHCSGCRQTAGRRVPRAADRGPVVLCTLCLTLRPRRAGVAGVDVGVHTSTRGRHVHHDPPLRLRLQDTLRSLGVPFHGVRGTAASQSASRRFCSGTRTRILELAFGQVAGVPSARLFVPSTPRAAGPRWAARCPRHVGGPPRHRDHARR